MGLKPVRVGQLNNYIGRVLRTDPILGNVSVIGEISNLKFHSSGHVYFSLKDDDSRINCFLASGNLEKITCPIDEGMEIIAHGYISLYERGGYYSLNVRDIEVNGEGQLAIQFEKLKNKLAAEGLFDEQHKKTIPAFASAVAVVTSETGAAVKDIIRTIRNKNDYTDILVYPVLVQGPAAAKDIAKAIDNINMNYPHVDVIITGRGGGSMEELWAFNEEIVVRSISASDIPVISAVGHESDFTISDFVADVRAATPTAAAEIAAFDTGMIRDYLKDMKLSLSESLTGRIDRMGNMLELLDPTAFSQSIQSRICYEQQNAVKIMESMTECIISRLASCTEKTEMLKNFIESSNPRSILARGYSVVTDSRGHIIKSTVNMEKGQIVSIETGFGSAEAEILSVKQGG